MTTQNYRAFADGKLLGENIRAAFRFGQRLRGLLGYPSLEQRSGLWLNPGGSVHTFGMRYPIDVVFLDERLRILDARDSVVPNKTCWAPRRTHSTLELWAGACAQQDVKAGQQLRFEIGDND